MEEPREIRKLDEVVINRIAAGEIIQRPCNALKEMIENSIDAKSTNIQVSVKNGGLKLLQIVDNGTGIRVEDFEILCERFTTSKLREFEDLKSINTYGFRGEALASISHVAFLTITSKTQSSKCCYIAKFRDGKMEAAPKPLGGNRGTKITVENLFYNMTVRKGALGSPTDEFSKIFDVVSKYAIHNSKIGFRLYKVGEDNSIRTPQNSTATENIRIIYGSQVARELIEFQVENESLKFKAEGLLTNVNYSTKYMRFILFINHRLVDCQSLKRTIDHIYTTYLPKNMHPFVYISLQIEPANIDVNVHPTKHEVHFINEDLIVEAVASAIDAKLLGSNNSRVFYTKAKLPGAQNLKITITEGKEKKVYDKDLVRTDPNEQKLERFFGPVIKKTASANDKPADVSLTEEAFSENNRKLLEKCENLESRMLDSSIPNLNYGNENGITEELLHSDADKSISSGQPSVSDETEVNAEKSLEKTSHAKLLSVFQSKNKCVTVKLCSVLQMQTKIENECDSFMRDIFCDHVYVGAVNARKSLIQHSTNLYICDTEKILAELFYQFLVFNFQNFDVYKLEEPLPVLHLAKMALDLPEAGWTPEDGDKNELAEKISEILTNNGDMLDEYYAMKINKDGMLLTLPVLIDDYKPSMSGLPMYLLRLATEVNWDEEQPCFASFSRETADYYAQVDDGAGDWRHVTEHVLYRAIKEYFSPSKDFRDNGAVLQIANLPSLYKVFERC